MVETEQMKMIGLTLWSSYINPKMRAELSSFRT